LILREFLLYRSHTAATPPEEGQAAPNPGEEQQDQDRGDQKPDVQPMEVSAPIPTSCSDVEESQAEQGPRDQDHPDSEAIFVISFHERFEKGIYQVFVFFFFKG
jgi:hypothetical protein